mgnify:CR=1 FL=1
MFHRISHRQSDCVDTMYVDPFRGVVQVAFAKGNVYEYTCVSRRAIILLMLNPCMSLGLWVNKYLLPYDCKTALIGDCRILPEVIFNSQLPVWSMNYTITWQTSLGRFGWTTIEDAIDMSDAIDCFNQCRRGELDSSVPFDATIDVIKPLKSWSPTQSINFPLMIQILTITYLTLISLAFMMLLSIYAKQKRGIRA